jgi:heptosyltransferase-2
MRRSGFVARGRHLAHEAAGRLAESLLPVAVRALSPPLRPAVAEARRIFVLRNNDLGDVLLATPLLAALARSHAGAIIEIGVGDWATPILDGNPHARPRLVPAPWSNKYVTPQSFGARWRFVRGAPQARELEADGFDVGIDVVGSRWGALLLRRCGMPRRLGVRGYDGGHSLATETIDFDPNEHVGRFALRFATLLGARELPPPTPQLFLSGGEKATGERTWQRGNPRIVLAPGGGLATKRWPADRFAGLAAALARAHPPAELLVLTGPAERELAVPILAACPTARWLAPELRALFALVAASDVVVSNSSVTLHVAAAFGKPTLVVLGPAFPSATHHQRQWGYDGLSVTLGDGMNRPADATPEMAASVLARQLLPLVGAGRGGR